MKEVVCLNCNSIIAIKGDPYLSQKLECQKCGAELEIVHMFPIELEWVYEDDDDYDEYDEYDDYDDYDDEDFDDDAEEEYDEEQYEAS